jgi:hypothetical protein
VKPIEKVLFRKEREYVSITGHPYQIEKSSRASEGI